MAKFSGLCRSNYGFTLIELSIVLVIIGLIVGGVLVGRNLIKASELHAVTVQQQQLVTAINTFQGKYSALPGDMQNATSYWGTASVCPGALASGSTDATTCNGNGNGQIDWSLATTNEKFRIWQHLANAGLLEGKYSGVSGNDGYHWNQSTSNSPQGKTPNSVWSIANWDNTPGNFTTYIAYINFGNMLLLGGVTPSSWNTSAILTPSDAYNIDNKTDDGIPNTGKIMSTLSLACANVANGGVSPAAYVITSKEVACYIYYPNAF